MFFTFNKLWNHHPYPDSPCNKALFANQCAIRMGVALEKSNVDTSTFDKMYPRRRCYPALKHSPAHILAAQELANWIDQEHNQFGRKKVYTKDALESLKGQKGIVFIMNGWENTDHIDLWDGLSLKGGIPQWLDFGEQVWFWKVPV